MNHTTRLSRLWARTAHFSLWAKAKTALTGYIEQLGPEEVEEAIIIAAERHGSKIDRWRYFCGVCRSKHEKPTNIIPLHDASSARPVVPQEG